MALSGEERHQAFQSVFLLFYCSSYWAVRKGTRPSNPFFYCSTVVLTERWGKAPGLPIRFSTVLLQFLLSGEERRQAFQSVFLQVARRCTCQKLDARNGAVRRWLWDFFYMLLSFNVYISRHEHSRTSMKYNEIMEVSRWCRVVWAPCCVCHLTSSHAKFCLSCQRQQRMLLNLQDGQVGACRNHQISKSMILFIPSGKLTLLLLWKDPPFYSWINPL